MTDFFGAVQIINQLIHRYPDGNAMGRAIVEALLANWQLRGCLWLGGINPETQNDSLQVIAGQRNLDNSISIQLVELIQSAEEILQQPPIQSILNSVNASGEETPQVLDLAEGDATILPIPLGSGLAIRTQFQGVVNGLLMVSNDSSHDWDDGEKTRLKIVAPVFAIASRLQKINNEQSQPLKLQDAVIDAFSDQTRNPLTIIRTAVELLSKSELTPEKRQSCRDSAIQACLDLQEIVNNIINHQKN